MSKAPRAWNLSPESLWLREERRIERIVLLEWRARQWAARREPGDPLPRQVVDAVDLKSETWKRLDRLLEEQAQLRRMEKSTRALRTTQRAHLFGWLKYLTTEVSPGSPTRSSPPPELWIDRGDGSLETDSAEVPHGLPAGLPFLRGRTLRFGSSCATDSSYVMHLTTNWLFHEAAHRESWRRRAARPWFRRWRRDAAVALAHGVAIQRLRDLLESLPGRRRAASAPIVSRYDGPEVDYLHERISLTIMPNAPSQTPLHIRLRQWGGQGVLATA